MKDERRKLREKVEELEEEILYIGGDFNATMGREEKRYKEKEDRKREKFND